MPPSDVLPPVDGSSVGSSVVVPSSSVPVSEVGSPSVGEGSVVEVVGAVSVVVVGAGSVVGAVVVSAVEYHHGYNLCLDCFTNNYGKIILEKRDAEYYGGHKAYLSGGYFDKFQSGRLILCEHYLIFAR